MRTPTLFVFSNPTGEHKLVTGEHKPCSSSTGFVGELLQCLILTPTGEHKHLDINPVGEHRPFTGVCVLLQGLCSPTGFVFSYRVNIQDPVCVLLQG